MKNNVIYTRWVLPLVFVAVAILMTIYETLKEYVFDGKLTHWESHTITIIFTSTLATVSALAMRDWAINVLRKEKELEVKTQSLISFELTLSAINHIVNNVLNYFQIIKLDIEMKGKVEKESLKLLDNSIHEATEQMRILNKIQNPSDPNSYQGIYPK